MKKIKPSWDASHHPARLWTKTEDRRVRCHLSPRNCTMREGQLGFCRVRQNVNGELISLNYGRATELTAESIETEAVFHFAPGARILSLGNIGCMMSCDYCHNWRTSQAKFVSAKDVQIYTPEQVCDIAEEQGIRILSWTYNDPVVWHEFVLDTAALARKRGMRNLYKSAFFISEEGASELCSVIDIFSISLKSMDPVFYRKISKGWIEPVLEATKLVYQRGKHVEISNLMVTDANDSEEDARALASWVLKELSHDVPLHFVRFHPDYKYKHVGRTPVDRLVHAREVAMSMGVKYCYLGNVYGHDGINTYCQACGSLMIERYGLNTWMRGVDSDGYCRNCGAWADLKELALSEPPEATVPLSTNGQDLNGAAYFAWEGDIRACHVAGRNGGTEDAHLYYFRVSEDGSEKGPYRRIIGGADRRRFILSKSEPQETGIRLRYPQDMEVKVFRVFDRAHYPTMDVDTEADHGPMDDGYAKSAPRPARAALSASDHHHSSRP